MKRDRKRNSRLDAIPAGIDGNAPRPTPDLDRKHQQIVNQHIPIGIVESSPEGKYIAVNDEFCQIVGYEREELLQLGIKDVTHESDYHIDIKLYHQLIAGEIPYYKIEKRFVRKDGRVIWCDLTRSVVRNARGKIRYAVGTVIDITEQQAAETALLQARTRAEQTTRRIARLQQITAALTGVATTRQLAETILEQGTQVTGASAGILMEALETGQELRTVAAIGYPAAAIRTEPTPLSLASPVSDCVRSRQAVWIGSQEEFAVRYAELADLRASFGNEATVALPLIAGERVLGALAFSFVEARSFDREEFEFFLAVAERFAQALERARSEDALRASEERLRLATEAARLCAWELDIREQTYTLGDNFAELLGFSPDLLPKTITEAAPYTPAEDLRVIREAVNDAVESRSDLRRLQFRFTNPENRQVLRLEINAKLIYDQEGNPVRMFGMAQNITDSKKLEEDLRASELLYRAIARSIPGGGVYVVDKDLRFLVAEGAITEAFGLSRESLEDRKVSEVFSGAMRQTLETNFERAFAGEQVSSELIQNGRIYWSQYAIMNDDLGHVIVITLDITERRRATEALRESEERFRAILSQATAGIVRKDYDGTYLFVNQAFCNMLDYTSAELVGRTCWEVTHEDDVEENRRLFERLMLEGIPFQMERRLIRRDGSILWANVSVSPIMDAAGKPLSAVGVEVDITARKQAEDALQNLNLELESRVERRTDELRVANLALQKSRGRLQELSRRLVEVQEEERRALARELHDRVGQSLAGLNINLTIINNELLRQNTEQLSTRLADSIKLVAEVIALVRDVMSNLRPSILDDYGLEAALQTYLSEFQSRSGVRIRFERPIPPLPRLDIGIEMTLLRISQEALTNIARHAQADEVVLSLRLDEKEICLTIEDNGLGLQPLQDTARPRSQGLKIMRERAEAFEGVLKVTSAPGKGTRIEATIPLPGAERETQV